MQKSEWQKTGITLEFRQPAALKMLHSSCSLCQRFNNCKMHLLKVVYDIFLSVFEEKLDLFFIS